MMSEDLIPTEDKTCSPVMIGVELVDLLFDAGPVNGADREELLHKAGEMICGCFCDRLCAQSIWVFGAPQGEPSGSYFGKPFAHSKFTEALQEVVSSGTVAVSGVDAETGSVVICWPLLEVHGCPSRLLLMARATCATWQTS